MENDLLQVPTIENNPPLEDKCGCGCSSGDGAGGGGGWW